MKVFFIGFIALFLCIGNNAYSNHLLGGELYYDCLGGDMYEVTLKLYRDCGPNNNNPGNFDNFSTISVYNIFDSLVANINMPFIDSVKMPVVVNNPCVTAPPNICIEEIIYSSIITIPMDSGGLDLVFQRCCRSNSVININNPSGIGSTYTTRIPDTNLAICNSSPRFNTNPPLVICLGEPFVFDHSASDPDSDSLVYEFCEIKRGGAPGPGTTKPNPASPPPFQDVTWSNGFSAQSPITSNPGFSIDPHTGVITGTPVAQGSYAVGICVKEYRNGILINTVTRDFMFTVSFCDRPTAEIVDQASLPSGAGSACSGLTISFLPADTTFFSYAWDFGDTNITTDTSSLVNPTYTFQDTGAYEVRLIINPGLPCADTAYSIFRMFPQIVASIVTPPGQCLDSNAFDFVPIGNFGGGATFEWTFGPNATPASSSLREPTRIHFDTVGNQTITLQVTDGDCDTTDTGIVTVFPHPIADFSAPDIVGCVPFKTSFLDQSFSWTGLTFEWSFGDSSISTDSLPTHVFREPGKYDITLTIRTDSGCVDTSAVIRKNLITVNPIPSAGFTASPQAQSLFEPLFTFEDTSSKGINCWLHFGNGETSSLCDTTFEFNARDTGTFSVMQVVENTFGCFDTTYRDVRVLPEFTFYVPNTFTPNGDDLNEVFLPKVFGAGQYEFYIYDRWGNLVFETKDPDTGWNGKINDKIAPAGTYAYVIDLLPFKGISRSYNGVIRLIR